MLVACHESRDVIKTFASRAPLAAFGSATSDCAGTPEDGRNGGKLLRATSRASTDSLAAEALARLHGSPGFRDRSASQRS